MSHCPKCNQGPLIEVKLNPDKEEFLLVCKVETCSYPFHEDLDITQLIYNKRIVHQESSNVVLQQQQQQQEDNTEPLFDAEDLQLLTQQTPSDNNNNNNNKEK